MFGSHHSLSIWRSLIKRSIQQFKQKNRSRSQRPQSTAASASASSSHSPVESKAMNPVLKSGLISGSLSLAGDLVAQILTNRSLDGNNSRGQSYDATRALRMGSFGLFFYGPYQHYWYQALDRAFSARTLQNFASKVALNQVCLAPVVITGVFAWNLALQGALSDLPGKLRRDFMPTIMTGWKFWVPAATINFVAVPLQHQVLYMSACGVIWTAFLSYSSSVSEKAQLK